MPQPLRRVSSLLLALLLIIAPLMAQSSDAVRSRVQELHSKGSEVRVSLTEALPFMGGSFGSSRTLSFCGKSLRKRPCFPLRKWPMFESRAVVSERRFGFLSRSGEVYCSPCALRLIP